MPVPPALGVCSDESVNGAPFYVMGYVDGVVLDSADRAAVGEGGTEIAPEAGIGRCRGEGEVAAVAAALQPLENLLLPLQSSAPSCNVKIEKF